MVFVYTSAGPRPFVIHFIGAKLCSSIWCLTWSLMYIKCDFIRSTLATKGDHCKSAWISERLLRSMRKCNLIYDLCFCSPRICFDFELLWLRSLAWRHTIFIAQNKMACLFGCFQRRAKTIVCCSKCEWSIYGSLKFTDSFVIPTEEWLISNWLPLSDV